MNRYIVRTSLCLGYTSLSLFFLSCCCLLSGCDSDLSTYLNKGVCAPDSEKLTPASRRILQAISTESVLNNSTIRQSLLLTACNKLDRISIDGPQIFSEIKIQISKAKHEVDIAFYKWEPESQAVEKMLEGLRAAVEAMPQGDELVIKILIDDQNTDFKRVVNDIKNSVNSINLDASRSIVQIATYDRSGLGVFHDKYVVVDGSVVVVTGANPEGYHDSPRPWHDTGYTFSGDVALTVLSSFDEAWNGEHVKHWSCRSRDFAFDCQETSHDSFSRRWLADIDRVRGDLNILGATRKANGTPNNNTNNAQDKAWLTTMATAGISVNVISPNINDDAFHSAIIDATKRGVKVNVITSLGFNNFTEGLPGQGGNNVEAAAKIRQKVRDEGGLAASRNLSICWHSRNGRIPVDGNGDFASHVKYMAADDKIAIVGSGNMDTQSWNQSRELNLVVDNQAATERMNRDIFNGDFASSICSYMELYEGNNCSEDIVLMKEITVNNTIQLSSDIIGGNNDEARSIAIYDAIPGKILTFYDDKDGDTQDDWTEILIKRNFPVKFIASFERTFEDDDVRQIYHRNNGLDGKVSRIKISTGNLQPRIDLYEGLHGSQNLLCSINATNNFVNKMDGDCDNDEAKSLRLYNITAGKALLLFDDKNADRNDDWAIIKIKEDIDHSLIRTFEQSYESNALQVYYFGHNGLNGKLSRIELLDADDIDGAISFYEGNNGSQNKVCEVTLTDRKIEFKNDNYGCDNDETRSVVLTFVPAGTEIKVYDDPDCDTSDDWSRIYVKRDLVRYTVNTFENSMEDDYVKVSYHHRNGLDGKVSCVKINMP